MTLDVQLENDLRWREAELAVFKRIISASHVGSTRQTTLLRAPLALLYAHYEGFCKFAWDLYLEEIERMGLSRQDVNASLSRLSLKKTLKGLRGDLSDESLMSFFKIRLPQLLQEKTTFPLKMETQSNLWPQLYCSNMKSLNFGEGEMANHQTIIKSLVGRRNDIAHGRKVYIENLRDYQKIEDSALVVMHDLAVAIINAIENETFRK